jgi:hypothetical protein
MRKEYKIGQESNKIYLDVIIGTPGIAHTKVFQFLSGGQHKLLTESDVDSGSLSNKFLGKGSDLIGCFIKIRTVIDFGSIDHSQWEQLSNTVVGKYGISGGFLGKQSYNYDEDDKTDSNNFRFVVIDMEIDLTK